jgi:putative SOS response-associated peptidase YedK
MSLSASSEDIRRKYPYLRFPWELAPHYNIAPAQAVPIAKNDASFEVAPAHWGLIASWVRSPKAARQPINARIETLADSRLFGPLLRWKRCAIFADGFFEWRLQDGTNTPYHFRLRSREPFAFAGLWDTWRGERDSEQITSCAIITGPPNALVAEIHDRMPMMLADADVPRWIADGELPEAAAIAMLHPYPAGEMERLRVSSLVNNARNDRPEVLEAV